MSTILTLRVGKETAKAELLETQAPNICEAILDTLPLRGHLIHAKMAGGEFFFKAPLFLEPENRVKKQEAGNICYWSAGQSIPIFYHSTPGVGEVSLFAKITDNLEGIRKEGLLGWRKAGTEIEIIEEE